jgi:excisionase family DNA binding protein
MTIRAPALRLGQVEKILARVDQVLDGTYSSDDLVMLTAVEVASLLGCSLGTVRRRIRAGDLPSVRLDGGRAVRISVADLRRYLRT